MKLAVLICGETRTWNSVNVERNSRIPRKYPCVAAGWNNLKNQLNELKNLQVDFYGITWQHCKKPQQSEIFKDIKFLDFYSPKYRSELLLKCQKEYNQMYPDVSLEDVEYFWNSMAQYYQWIEGLKFVYQSQEYDFVLKSRWDIAPDDDLPNTLISKMKTIIDFKYSFLGVEEMSIIENNIQDRTISFLDINFIINHQLFVERFQKKTTDTILYEHIKSKPPSGIGNYDLFFPYDHYPNKRKSQCIINPSMFVRIIEKGYSEYNYLEDYKKNLSKNRPPT